MSDFAKSTVAVMCFPDRHSIDFVRFLADLESALDASSEGTYRRSRRYDDFVTFDLGRFGLSFAFCDFETDAPELAEASGAASSLTIAITTHDGEEDGGWSSAQRRKLARQMIARIERSARNEHLWMTEVEGVFDEDVYDRTLDRMPQEAFGRHSRAEPAAPPPRDEADTAQRPARPARPGPRPTHPAAHADKPRAHGPAPHATRPPDEVAAFATPQGLAERFDAAKIREALHADAERGPPERALPAQSRNPLGIRLTTHALNSALMVIALPVGLAMLFCAFIGRESLTASARLTAVTGTTVGTANTDIGQTILSFIV